LQLVVGRIGRAHGVLGEATIEVRTDQPEQRFAVGNKLLLQSGQELIVKTNRWHNQILLLSFEGISGRTKIELLKDMLLTAQVDTTDLANGEYHYQQLIGASVYLQSGQLIGPVSEVVALPGQDLLAVDYLGKEVLIPMVKAIILDIDVANRKIIVNPPEGLLDVAL
jgi:16S rRNA processing protein RimM